MVINLTTSGKIFTLVLDCDEMLHMNVLGEGKASRMAGLVHGKGKSKAQSS